MAPVCRLAQNDKLLVRTLMTQIEWAWFESHICGSLIVMDCFCLSFDIKSKMYEDTKTAARIRRVKMPHHTQIP